MSFARLAGLRIFDDGDCGVVDRTEIPDEARPCDPEFHLAIAPRPISLLCLEDLTHGIADRDQLSQNADVLFGDAIATPTLSSHDCQRGAFDHLHQTELAIDEEAAFPNAGMVRFEIDDLAEFELKVDVDLSCLAVIEAGGKLDDGTIKDGFQINIYTRVACIGLAIGTGGECVCAEGKVRMLRQPAINANGTGVGRCGLDLSKVEPGRIALSLANFPLAEEQDVDDDVGAGVAAEAAFRQPDGCDEIG